MLISIVPRNVHTKYELNTVKTKKLSGLHSSCHGNLITNKLATRNVADAFISKNLHSKYKLNTT